MGSQRVESLYLDLETCGQADPMFGFGIGNGNKMPGLMICAARGGSCCFDTVFDNSTRDRSMRIVPHGVPPADLVIESSGGLSHLTVRQIAAIR